MYAALKATVAGRLSEARRIIALARSIESAADADARSLRGVVYVLLYGAVEYSVSNAVQTVLRFISESDASYSELRQSVYAIALDAHFTSLAFVGSEKKWAKRLELLEHQTSASICRIRDDLLTDQLQNVRISTLRSLFGALGLNGDVVSHPSFLGYINDIADRRNELAHGELSPADVGGRKTNDDVERALSAVDDTVSYLLDRFENYCRQREFIQQ